jgi:N-methylhydantoinase A
MRYKGQEHTVKVPIPSEAQLTPVQLQEINDLFHRLHEQAYTFRLESPIELVNYHLTALGTVQKAEIPTISPAPARLEPAQKGKRQVNFDELGYHLSPIYERDLLPLHQPVSGPVVIEEPTATTIVFPDQQVIRDGYGLLHIENREGD